MGGKFELLAVDKNDVVGFVNAMGAAVTEYKNKSAVEKLSDGLGGFVSRLFDPSQERLNPTVKDEILKLSLDSHEGRKAFLANKLGIDANTSDDYRLVAYQNQMGQQIYFRGHIDGEKKLVLTDSLPVPEASGQLQQFFQSSFRALPKPIEVQIEKSKPNKDGSVNYELSPAEQTKLETQATFASLIHKSDGVQLASNSALPGKQRSTGPTLTV